MQNMLWSLVSWMPADSTPLTSENIYSSVHLDNLDRVMGLGNGLTPKDWIEKADKSELVERTSFCIEKSGIFGKKRAIKDIKKTGDIIGCYFAIVQENGMVHDSNGTSLPFYRARGKFYSFH